MDSIMTIDTIGSEIKNHLENQKQAINDEIFHYPPPIPACDAQFNYLLEQRALLRQELHRLQDTLKNDTVPALAEFINTCPFIEADTAANWMQQVNKLVQHAC